MRTKLKRMSLAIVLTLTMMLGTLAAPMVANASESTQTVQTYRQVATPTYEYSAMEVQIWYNATHKRNIDRTEAHRRAVYMNAVVANQLRWYAFAVYLNAVSAAQTCSSPSTCATLIKSVFSSYGLDGNAAVRVATCESGLNPRATNGSHDGLFQQARQYWAGRSRQYGMAGRSAYDPFANATVSAGMVRDTGGWSHWSCKP